MNSTRVRKLIAYKGSKQSMGRWGPIKSQLDFAWVSPKGNVASLELFIGPQWTNAIEASPTTMALSFHEFDGLSQNKEKRKRIIEFFSFLKRK